MNDRFLYRAKRTDNGEWVEGDLVHSVYKINDICVGKYGSEVGMHQVDPSTICQRVPCGGCPLDEKPIWENDIVTDGYYVGVVQFGVYESKFFGFFIEWKNGYEGLREDFLYWLPKIKSIGNIFDNPELLEVGE